MKIVLLLVGKTTDKHLQTLIAEYQQRVQHYIGFESVVIPELKNTKNLSVAEQKEKEADLIIKQIDTKDDVILLDEGGNTYSSVEFSAFLAKKMHSTAKRTVFVVGGPYGFSQRIYKLAGGMISLSRMTFSQQMIWLLFTEQLYRAMTILKGENYHHE